MVARTHCLCISILMAVLILLAVDSYGADEWTGEDKKLHYAVSIPFGVIGAMIIEDCCSEWPGYYKIPASVGIGTLTGLFKETIDHYDGSGWDNQDLLAASLGSLTGVITFKVIF